MGKLNVKDQMLSSATHKHGGERISNFLYGANEAD